jgi:hypothetical protein
LDSVLTGISTRSRVPGATDTSPISKGLRRAMPLFPFQKSRSARLGNPNSTVHAAPA